MSKLYPWHKAAWERIQAMRVANRVPHALLISGKQGTGISEFAMRLAASSLCESPSENGDLCEQCQSCELLKANTHPELLSIVPEEEAKDIKVDQVRQLLEFIQLKSHYGNHKIVIIDPADVMTGNANNSLLKTLEEPPGNSLIILVSHQPAMLPITVRSRCQKIEITASSMHIKAWLGGKFDADLIDTAQAIGYGPLFLGQNADIELHQNRMALVKDLEDLSTGQGDPLDIAKVWSKTDIKQVFFWLMKILLDLAKFKLVGETPQLANKDLIDRLRKLSEAIDIKSVINLYEKLFETHKLIARNTTLKSQTMCEEITLNWAKASRQTQTR